MEANAAFAGSIPQNYDQFLGPLLFEPYALDLIGRIDKNKSAVLELACGTGRVTKHLLSLFSGDKITATDLNPDMIAIAQKRISDKGIKWIPADMQELPFKDESFDQAICQYGIMFVPDKPKAIKEIARVLKKGGVFHFNTWDRVENVGVPRIAKKVVTEFFNGTPPSFYAVPFSMFNPDEISALMKNNGFSNVKIELVKKTGQSPSALDAARGLIEGNPVIKEIQDRDPNGVKPIIEKVRKEIAEQFGDNPVRCPLQAWVGMATK